MTVNINGTDSLSGIDSCTAPVSLSTEGAGQSGSGTCTDLAGNVSAAATASGIKIDLTAPTLTFGAASPAANAAGWNNTDVSVPFTAADVLSGVDITSPAVSPLVLSAEGSAVTGTVTVADLAGNNAVLTSPAVKIDKTPPLVSASSTPGPNANGWNNTDVTVNFAAVDGLSGVGPFSDPVTVTTEGAGQLISGTATDLAGNLGGASVTLSIDKTAPIVSDVMGTPNPVEIDISSEVTATVSNPTQAGAPIVAADFQIEGGAFTAMAAVDGFGDLTESVTSAPVLPSFSPASVQTICVQGTDAADNVSDLECTLLVVFDPSGGFVTGSGFINSPSGAYTPNDPLDEDFTGKANFGFVSKYKKGATTPIGETEFRFKVADLNFHSTSYDWLVVAGAKAQFKGDGTVNGQFGSNNTSGYGFLLTATDGQQPGGLGTDKFRIKIVDKFTDTVLYDNVAGESEDIDDAMPTTVAGGSIVIHKKAVK